MEQHAQAITTGRMISHAEETGLDPGADVQRMQQGLFTGQDVHKFIATSGEKPNPTLLEQVGNWFADEKVPNGLKIAAAIGIPLAIIGAASIAFGQEGVGAGLLGLGAGVGAYGMGAFDKMLPQQYQSGNFMAGGIRDMANRVLPRTVLPTAEVQSTRDAIGNQQATQQQQLREAATSSPGGATGATRPNQAAGAAKDPMLAEAQQLAKQHPWLDAYKAKGEGGDPQAFDPTDAKPVISDWAQGQGASNQQIQQLIANMSPEMRRSMLQQVRDSKDFQGKLGAVLV